MSNPLRIGLVAEGVTDFVILHSALESIFQGSGYTFDLKLLQPEESIAFSGAGKAGVFGGGWLGVYKWCLQSVEIGGGSLSGDPLFENIDFVILHLDADVADEDPSKNPHNPFIELNEMLPCSKPCPPASNTTKELRSLLLRWVGEVSVPDKVVLCTPSKSTEAWVMAALFPNDSQMKKKGFECFPKPEDRFAQQKNDARIKKNRSDYEKISRRFTEAWPKLILQLSEANRFDSDLKKVL